MAKYATRTIMGQPQLLSLTSLLSSILILTHVPVPPSPSPTSSPLLRSPLLRLLTHVPVPLGTVIIVFHGLVETPVVTHIVLSPPHEIGVSLSITRSVMLLGISIHPITKPGKLHIIIGISY